MAAQKIILNGRIVNDSMGAYVADAAIKKMIEAGQAPRKSKVIILVVNKVRAETRLAIIKEAILGIIQAEIL